MTPLVILCLVLAALTVPACGPAPSDSAEPPPTERQQFSATRAVPGDFATIQEALDAAADGDVVEVAPGSYDEELTLPAGVRLSGDPADPATIHGRIVVDGVEGSSIAHLAIVGPGRFLASIGLAITDSAVTVESVTIEEHSAGLFITGGAGGEDGGVRIAGAQISNNGRGVIIDGAQNVWIVNGVFLFNDGAAVTIRTQLGDNVNVHVVHNTMVANGFSGGSGAAFDAEGAGWRGSGNLIVSGDIGLKCVDGPCDHDYDLVFGNRIDYAGVATPGAKDVFGDPLFINPGALDLRLQRRSPAVDAGDPNSGLLIDFDGVDRPFGPGPDIGAFEFAPASSRLTLAINEVMANPLDEAKDEFVELYNFGQNPVDAAGIQLSDGDSNDIVQAWDDGGPTEIPAGGYALILDTGYVGFYGDFPEGVVLLTVGNATLGNGLSTNDPLTLREPGGRRIDTYSFPRKSGNGVSIEKRDVLAGDAADNWLPSPCGNSPGRENCVLQPPIDPANVPLVITEVMSNPLSERTGEYVELFNTSEDQPFDLRNLRLTDGDRTDVLVPRDGGSTVIPPPQLRPDPRP